MEQICIEEILLNIMNHLDLEDILNLRYTINNFETLDEIIYWKSLEHKKVLISDHYLLKNEFEWIIEKGQESLIYIYEYLKNEPNICIAGGYPTIQFLNKPISEFPNSDIDVYIFNDHKNTLKNFLEHLDKHIGMRRIEFHGKHFDKKSIYNIYLKGINRPIQVIGIINESISSILRQYDASHVRCCLYLGNTYVTYDAKYSKKINTTYFYKNKNNYGRLNKAHKLGLKIFHLPKYVPHILSMKRSKLCHYTIKNVIYDFTPVENWIKSYTRGQYIENRNQLIKLSLDKYVIPLIGYEHKYYHQIVLKTTRDHIFNNKMKEYGLGIYTFTTIGILNKYDDDVCSIVTYDIEIIKRLKNILKKLFYDYHGKSLKEFNTDKKYDKYHIGEHYHDNLVINNDCAYIKNIKYNNELHDEHTFTIQCHLRYYPIKRKQRGFYPNYGHIKYKIIDAKKMKN